MEGKCSVGSRLRNREGTMDGKQQRRGRSDRMDHWWDEAVDEGGSLGEGAVL